MSVNFLNQKFKIPFIRSGNKSACLIEDQQIELGAKQIWQNRRRMFFCRNEKDVL